MRRLYLFPLIVFLSAIFTVNGVAQQKSEAMSGGSKKLTAKAYKRAAKFLSRNTYKLVQDEVSGQSWTADDRLMYSTRTSNGEKYIIASPSKSEKKAAFNANKLAESLSHLTGQKVEADQLHLRGMSLSGHGDTLRYYRRGGFYKTDLTNYTTRKVTQGGGYNQVISPDGEKAAYIKNYNLWVRNTQTGERTELTTDGKKNYGYATNNAGWTRSSRPVLKWGPHSEQIATFRQDARGVGEMYLYNTKVGHSKLYKWKYAFPGDSTFFHIERVVVHLPKGSHKPKVTHLKMKPDAQRSTISDEVAGRGGRLLDTQWSKDGSHLFFVSVSRNHKVNTLREADANTGVVRDVLTEKAKTYYESGYSEESWQVLPKANEVIWFSERSNWANLYLYDLKTGKLKHQITPGNPRVLDLQKVDEKNRTIYFTGSNHTKGNPYDHHLYKINFDGSGLQNLTPEEASHQIDWSTSGKYFTDIYSTPDMPPVSVIRDTNGDKVMNLEQADISRLKNMGWKPPTPFKVKARDGETELYGLIFKPTHFDSTKSYPVVNYLYPGPQSGSVRSWGFLPARGDDQALAELGFIVVEVNAMGTPGRSKSFHDKWYGHMHDNGIPDQVATIRQLAARHAWMDTSRVGIWGHSGGGFASTDAMLTYPNFYKVAVSESGNHDNRNYESDWGDKWQGLLKRSKSGKMDAQKPYVQGDNYDSQANENYVDNLKGHLLLIHGLMDDNVPPTNTLLVANALIKAGKDFDMFLIPNAHHGYGYAGDYIMNKRWDYFVKHLMGATPPPDFHFGDNH